MNILIIDKEPLMLNLLKSKLSQMGNNITAEDSKNMAINGIAGTSFDCIFIDPSPLKNVRPVVFDILRSLEKSRHRPYIVLMSKESSRQEAHKGFCNDLLPKPFDHEFLKTIMENANRLKRYYEIMGVDNNDLSVDLSVSGGLGIIDQTAFRQLFLASIDRGFRYGERNFILFVDITNLSEIASNIGRESLNDMLAEFAEKISWIRRQSDVVGRVSEGGFGVLMQRPMYETEIHDAFSRFGEKVKSIINEIVNEADPTVKFECSLSVVEMPFCGLSFSSSF